MYSDRGAVRSVCGAERLLDPEVCFDLLLLLDVVLRLSLSLDRRVRTGFSELSYGKGMVDTLPRISTSQTGPVVILFAMSNTKLTPSSKTTRKQFPN